MIFQTILMLKAIFDPCTLYQKLEVRWFFQTSCDWLLTFILENDPEVSYHLSIHYKLQCHSRRFFNFLSRLTASWWLQPVLCYAGYYWLITATTCKLSPRREVIVKPHWSAAHWDPISCALICSMTIPNV